MTVILLILVVVPILYKSMDMTEAYLIYELYAIDAGVNLTKSFYSFASLHVITVYFTLRYHI